jgi:hypothetical protein
VAWRTASARLRVGAWGALPDPTRRWLHHRLRLLQAVRHAHLAVHGHCGGEVVPRLLAVARAGRGCRGRGGSGQRGDACRAARRAPAPPGSAHFAPVEHVLDHVTTDVQRLPAEIFIREGPSEVHRWVVARRLLRAAPGAPASTVSPRTPDPGIGGDGHHMVPPGRQGDARRGLADFSHSLPRPASLRRRDPRSGRTREEDQR